jgi:hypothetical protein
MLSSAGNKRISAKAPSSYLADVAAAAGDRLERWLSSNLITLDAYEAARNDDYEKFLKIRASTIHEYVIKQAGWPPKNDSGTPEI